MNYLLLKHLHVFCAGLSGLGFILRGIWMLVDSPHLRAPWVRVTPHVVDTLLLASALAMVALSGQYPFVQTWLTAKVCGLFVYIVCGTVALKHGRSKRQRTVFFALSLLALAYIVGVALIRNPYLAW